MTEVYSEGILSVTFVLPEKTFLLYRSLESRLSRESQRKRLKAHRSKLQQNLMLSRNPSRSCIRLLAEGMLSKLPSFCRQGMIPLYLWVSPFQG